MEIYYKVPIWDRLYKAIYDADIENKIIDYIVVNDKEWDQLIMWSNNICDYRPVNPFSAGEGMFYGVKIYKRNAVNVTTRVEEENK